MKRETKNWLHWVAGLFVGGAIVLYLAVQRYNEVCK